MHSFHVFLVGNLGRVDHVTEFEYDLFIRPDTCNPRFRVWFNFTVENVKESQVGDAELDSMLALKIPDSRRYFFWIKKWRPGFVTKNLP